MRGIERKVDPVKLLKVIWVPAAGMFLVAAGFVYDLLFAGIPYQDPTPEMQASWEFHRSVASIVQVSGAICFLFGAIAIPLIWKRAKSEGKVPDEA